MAVQKQTAGKTEAGEEVCIYTLSNKKGINAQVMNYGAILVRLYVPDPKGGVEDIVLGFDAPEDYSMNSSFFGTTVGPNANRIKEAAFNIEGIEYHLEVNEGGNNLHSHFQKGFHKRVWRSELVNNGVMFSLEAPDGDLGFPGNRKISLTYTLTEDNELRIQYHGTSDKKTILNMTNHSYFNLGGHGSGDICRDELWINADYYTPVAPGAIPTGDLLPVAGTPMDFTKPKQIGLEIDADFEQLKLVGGYDHNWVLKGEAGKCRLFARLENKTSGRVMEAYTDLPGVQFYSGNGIETQTGKGGAVYAARAGLCLETQYYPDAIHQPEFPQPIFGEGKEYDSTTIYKFI